MFRPNSFFGLRIAILARSNNRRRKLWTNRGKQSIVTPLDFYVAISHVIPRAESELMPRASLIATLFEPPSPDGAELTALPDAVDWLEVRADRVGDIDPEWLRDHFKGRLLYSFRNGSSLNRHERLKSAARFYDKTELEIGTDTSEELLELVPVEKRLLSWYAK